MISLTVIISCYGDQGLVDGSEEDRVTSTQRDLKWLVVLNDIIVNDDDVDTTLRVQRWASSVIEWDISKSHIVKAWKEIQSKRVE